MSIVFRILVTLIFLVGLTVAASAHTQQVKEAIAKIPLQGRTTQAFVPKGWRYIPKQRAT